MKERKSERRFVSLVPVFSRFTFLVSRFTVLVVFALCLALPFSAQATDRLVVRDGNDNTKFVVQETGLTGIGTATPSGGSLHVYAPNVATLTDILGNNQVAGSGFDIQTATGTPPSGPIQAINGEFLIKYTPGVAISNNFNTFRMIARTDSSVSSQLTGNLAAGNFIAQHKGGNTASIVTALVSNVALQGTGNITSGTAFRAASPGRSGSGTIANAYGIDILAQKVTGVTNGYGVFQEGANDKNYFAGNVGIGTAPSHLLELAGGAYSDGNAWYPASSRALKENIKELGTSEAMNTLVGLNPVKYNYKNDKNQQHVGFIAEDVPELVALKDRKALSPMDIVAVLTKVLQEQQKTISQLSEKVTELQKEVRLKNGFASLDSK